MLRYLSTATLAMRTSSPSVRAWFSFWSWLRQAQTSFFKDSARFSGNTIHRCPIDAVSAKVGSSSFNLARSPDGENLASWTKRKATL